MVSWAFWLVIILLAILIILGARFAISEYRKNKKVGSAVVHYILLVLLTILVIKLVFSVLALARAF